MPNKVARWRELILADTGREWLVEETHRHGTKFRDPDNPRRHRLLTSIGEAYTRDGREIDTDLDDTTVDDNDFIFAEGA